MSSPLSTKILLRAAFEAVAEMKVDPDEYTSRVVFNVVKNSPTPDLIGEAVATLSELMDDLIAETLGTAVRNTPPQQRATDQDGYPVNLGEPKLHG